MNLHKPSSVDVQETVVCVPYLQGTEFSRTLQPCFRSGIISNAFLTNSVAFLNGGLVIISPSPFLVIVRKEIIYFIFTSIYQVAAPYIVTIPFKLIG